MCFVSFLGHSSNNVHQTYELEVSFMVLKNEALLTRYAKVKSSKCPLCHLLETFSILTFNSANSMKIYSRETSWV